MAEGGWSPGPGDGAGGTFWSHPHRRTGAILIGAGAMLIVLAAAYASWLCTDATYKCPANGCGNVPAQNCGSGLNVLLGSVIGGLTLASVGTVLFLAVASDRSPGHPAAKGGPP